MRPWDNVDGDGRPDARFRHPNLMDVWWNNFYPRTSTFTTLGVGTEGVDSTSHVVSLEAIRALDVQTKGYVLNSNDVQAPNTSATNCTQQQHITLVMQIADILKYPIAKADTMVTVQGLDSILGTTRLSTSFGTYQD